MMKVAFLTLFWVATFFMPPPEYTLPIAERVVVLLLFLLANAVAAYGYCFREARGAATLRTLFALDLFFILYLAKYYLAYQSLLGLLLVGVILFESLVVSRALGAVALGFSVATVLVVAYLSPAEAGYFHLGGAWLGVLYTTLILLVTYGFAYSVVSHHKQIMREGEVLTQELTDSTVASELACREVVVRNQQLSTLLQISESLSSSLEVDRLFMNFRQAIHNSVDFDNFSLLVYDAEVSAFRVIASGGEYYDLADARIVPLDRGVAGHVYNRGTSYLVASAARDPLVAELPETAGGVGSLMAAPLFFQDDILGVLILEAETEGKFSHEQMRFVESITPLVAIAVHNVVSYQLIKTASTRDKLTNLYNYFAFTQRFYEMLENAQHRQRPLTLLLLDLDDFKLVNDTYGHLAGNTVLAQMGELLTSFFRRSDLVARYGGEEFAVVLNGTPMDIGLVLADTLRQALEETEFLGGTQPVVRITTSIGVSSTQDEGIEFVVRPSRRRDDDHYVENLEEIAEKMISSADAAMYLSKHAGKNRVTASQNSRVEPKDFTQYRKKAPEGALPRVDKKPSWKTR